MKLMPQVTTAADCALGCPAGHSLSKATVAHSFAAAGPVPSGLASALSALDSLEGPPSYLTPEATRPLASSAYHGRLVQAAGISPVSASSQE